MAFSDFFKRTKARLSDSFSAGISSVKKDVTPTLNFFNRIGRSSTQAAGDFKFGDITPSLKYVERFGKDVESLGGRLLKTPRKDVAFSGRVITNLLENLRSTVSEGREVERGLFPDFTPQAHRGTLAEDVLLLNASDVSNAATILAEEGFSAIRPKEFIKAYTETRESGGGVLRSLGEGFSTPTGIILGAALDVDEIFKSLGKVDDLADAAKRLNVPLDSVVMDVTARSRAFEDMDMYFVDMRTNTRFLVPDDLKYKAAILDSVGENGVWHIESSSRESTRLLSDVKGKVTDKFLDNLPRGELDPEASLKLKVFERLRSESLLDEGKVFNNELGLHKLDAVEDTGGSIVEDFKKVDAEMEWGREGTTKLQRFFTPVRQLSDDLGNNFKTWVNNRTASRFEGILASKRFKNFDKDGLQALIDFQSGSQTKRFKDVSNYFDSKYKVLKDAGFDFKFRQHYLPQLWDNTPEEINKVFDRVISTNPTFTKERVIADYATGIEAGLTPRYEKISDLVAWYERTSNKALANKNFLEYLFKNKYVTTKKIPGWKVLDPDAFPGHVIVRKGEFSNVPYRAHPVLHEILSNYLVRAPQGHAARAVGAYADFTRFTKNLVLSFGVPKTAINFHGVNTLRRSILADKNPVNALVRGLGWMVNPKGARKFVDANYADVTRAVKSGMSISSEGREARRIVDAAEESAGFIRKATDKYTGLLNKLFEEPLFDKFIPALKTHYFRQLEAEYLGFLPPERASKQAAETVNNMFGGINGAELGRSKGFSDLMSSIFLAPDWGETQLRLAGKLYNPKFMLTKQGSRAYRTMARNLVITYIMQNFVNKIMSGQWMFQNEAGRNFEVNLGVRDSQGRPIYLRPNGTAEDFVRIPYDVAWSIMSGDVDSIPRVIRNRLSIPIGTGAGLLFNVDYAGNPIFYTESNIKSNPYFSKKTPDTLLSGGAKAAGELSGMVFPSPVRQGISVAQGRVSPELAILQALELPFRAGRRPKKPKKRTSKTLPSGARTPLSTGARKTLSR